MGLEAITSLRCTCRIPSLTHYDNSENWRGERIMSESKQGIMDKFQGFMEEKILPFATKLGNQRHMAAIRDGMSILIPLTIIGGIAMVLAIPPVPSGIENTNFFYGFLLAWQSWAATYNAP